MNNSEPNIINDVSSIPLKIDQESGQKTIQKEIFRTKRSYVPVELDKRQKLI
jgi:hypothetical protein